MLCACWSETYTTPVSGATARPKGYTNVAAAHGPSAAPIAPAPVPIKTSRRVDRAAAAARNRRRRGGVTTVVALDRGERERREAGREDEVHPEHEERDLDDLVDEI